MAVEHDMKAKVIALVLVVVVTFSVFLLWRGDSVKRVLPDGTVLVLSGVQVGSSNVYVHGSTLSKMLGRLIPSNGITVAKIQLQRPKVLTMPAPEGEEHLTAELQLRARSPQENAFVSPPFYGKHRLLISSDDGSGFVFVKDLMDFRAQPDGLFAPIYAWSYPRDAARLRFRLEERSAWETRDWREVATFVTRNPKQVQVAAWKPQVAPRLKLVDGLELEVGELKVSHVPVHPASIWDDTGFLNVRVLRNGVMATNWSIKDGKTWDAIGNYDSFSYGSTKRIMNDWMEYRVHRPLDPTKVWKFKVNIARDADYPATNLYSFTVTWPMTSVIQTNFGGNPVAIDFVNTDMLSVQMTNKPAQTRLTFVKAVDGSGADISARTGSWGQYGFWQSLKLPRMAGATAVQVHATVAVHENYEAEFMLQPRYEPQPDLDRGR